MAMFARQNVRTARCTDGVNAETVLQNHTAIGDTIKVRCLINPTSVAADSVRSVVVRHNK